MNSGGPPTLDGPGAIFQGVNQLLQGVSRVTAIHEEILATTRRSCVAGRTSTFTPVEVVRGLAAMPVTPAGRHRRAIPIRTAGYDRNPPGALGVRGVARR